MAYLTSAALANAWGSRRPGPLWGCRSIQNLAAQPLLDQAARPIRCAGRGRTGAHGRLLGDGGVSEKSEPRDIHQSILFEIAQSYEEM